MPRVQRVHLFAILCSLLAAFALRIQHLGEQSLWYDETVSAYLASNSLSALIAHTARDIHPPLYYIWLHFWQRLGGGSDFSLAYASLFWGVLLIASTVTFARWIGGRQVALLTTALLVLSPFNIWYSQEVRMYTMGATFGVWTLMALWVLLTGRRMKKRWLILWLVGALAGLYTLYYFAFLLIWEGIFVTIWLWRNHATRGAWQRWCIVAVLFVIGYAPWIPTAFRQATEPPVPPWRGSTPLGTMLLETLTAYALGQSASYGSLQIAIILLAVVIVGGLALRLRQRNSKWVIALLVGAFLVPFIILVLSTFTSAPLYHVRYTFTYSPAFYVLLAIAFAGWVRFLQKRAGTVGASIAGLVLITPLMLLSAESLQRFWSDTTYASDDLRGGVVQIEQQWRDTDVVLANAGYTYTALDTYLHDPVAWQGRLTNWQPDVSGSPDTPGISILETGSMGGAPTLGWGLPESDFYATTQGDTIAALERVKAARARLWQFRLYDTVTDPQGVIRQWLDDNALLFYDAPLTGESNARVQGWYFPPTIRERPARALDVTFLAPDAATPWITLEGVDDPTGPQAGGGWVDVTIWVEGNATLDPSVRLSLGLFDTTPARRQWAVADEQVLGPMLSLQQVEGRQRWTVRLRLPQGVPPGKYDALLKFYRPSDGAVLTAQGARVEANQQQVRVAVIEVGPTPPMDEPPGVGTPLEARFGPVEFLGHAIPPGPWQPGASISVELVWRKLEEGSDIRAFITSDALASDDGGVVASYPFDQWRSDGVVRDIHYVTIAPDAVPGEYPLYLRVAQGPETVPWTQGIFRNGEVLQIGTLEVVDRPRVFEKPAVNTPFSVAFGDSIELVGATPPITTTPYLHGADVPLTLNWYATARVPTRYKIFTHLISPDGNLRAQRDLEPGDGTLPTNGWARGEYVTMSYAVTLPPDAPPGRYEVRIGLYDPITNARPLPVGTGANGDERYVVVGYIEVQ